MQIQTEGSLGASLESLRPLSTPAWQFVASGYWSQGRYHSGHIAYFVACVGPGQWLLDSVERSTLLDDVTQEDIDEDRLNDDQAQALWGMSLEQAQAAEYRRIVAACSGASDSISAKDVAVALYRAACADGGKSINEFDPVSGLLT